MPKKLTRPIIIGGIIGLAIHFLLEHQGDLQSFLTIGAHNINGIAFTLAGAFLGWYLK